MNPIDQIDAMLALCARATPGPWEIDNGLHREVWDHTGDVHICTIARHTLANYDDDQPFIAASRTGWEATLRTLKMACEFIDDSIACNEPVTGTDPWVETAREVRAKIAKELEATQ